jgi:hypothetical protein
MTTRSTFEGSLIASSANTGCHVVPGTNELMDDAAAYALGEIYMSSAKKVN